MQAITTIKLYKQTKDELDHFRQSKESYDTAIQRLITAMKQKTRKHDLIEGYRVMREHHLEIEEEWDAASYQDDSAW
ncbi:hypothetical protein HYU19_05505 [Candidatus Woesearchaeota archaeon]|nr:hypothetical protein [Candidatus Woesearchaeota archaeon]